MYRFTAMMALFVFLSSSLCGEDSPTSPDEKIVLAQVSVKYRSLVEKQLARSGKNRGQLVEALEKAPNDHKEETAFLIAYMPRRDLTTLPASRLVETVTLARKAYNQAPWKDQIPRKIYLNDVLPYCNVNEKRDPWRADFYQRFASRAQKKGSLGKAAVWLNNTIFGELKVRYHPTKRPKPDQSPAESIRAGYASCTGLSILLINACRASGIPARMAGIPAWKDGRGDKQGNHGGNHNWVEVWDGKRWQHLGASEKSRLSRTWFTAKTATASDTSKWYHRIYAASYKKTGVRYPLVWNLQIRYVSAVDVTKYYQKRGWEISGQ